MLSGWEIQKFQTYRNIGKDMAKIEALLEDATANVQTAPVKSFGCINEAREIFTNMHNFYASTANSPTFKAVREFDEIALPLQREAYKNMGADADKTLRGEFGMAVYEVPHPIKDGIRKLFGKDETPPDIRFGSLEIAR